MRLFETVAATQAGQALSRKEVLRWLEAYVKNFDLNKVSIKPDMIDYNGDVTMKDPNFEEKRAKQAGGKDQYGMWTPPAFLSELPFKFGIVSGVFNVDSVGLKTLKNCPDVCNAFICSRNNIVNLEGGPRHVGTSYTAAYNSNLASLDGVAKHIGGSLYLAVTKISDLKGIHKRISHIGNAIDLTSSSVQSSILGTLMVKGLRTLKGDSINLTGLGQACTIVNKHLKADRDINMCQEDLIEAGLAPFARL